MLRAAYMAQEILTTFTDEIHGILLQPSEINGRYTVCINGREVFDRKRAGHLPEIKVLKLLIREVVAPEKNLGHSDKNNTPGKL